MNQEYQLVVMAVISLAIGFFIAWKIMQTRLKDLMSQSTEKNYNLENKLEQVETEKNEAVKNGAVAEQKAKRVAILEDELSKERAVVDDLRQQKSSQESNIAILKTKIEEERKQAEEKLALLNEAKVELTNQFKNLANEIFDEKGKKFTEQNHQKLDTLLGPFREQIKDFKKKVDDVYVADSKERATLKHELESLRKLNQQINQDAVNLTRALKGDKKVQGNWGELVLERVLEQSGLRKGVEYATQGGFRDSENKLMKPDVIIHLPEDKDVVIDSKLSLIAYERYCSAEEEEERAAALMEHVAAVRNHIQALSLKDYSSLKGIRSLDFVIMFMPVEPAFLAAFHRDEKLFAEAFESKIVVVTPTTLLAALRTIESIWRYERQNQNAKAIADRAGAIYDKLCGFVNDMEKLGKQLSTAHGTYDDAMNKLKTGRGNLINQASQFIELGVKVKKTLPKSIMEEAELQD